MSGHPRETPRAKRRCHYCKTILTSATGSRDHVVPLSRGGVDRAWNIVQSCVVCNKARSNEWPTCSCNVCHAAITRHAELGVTREGITTPAWAKPTRRGRSSYVKKPDIREESVHEVVR